MAPAGVRPALLAALLAGARAGRRAGAARRGPPGRGHGDRPRGRRARRPRWAAGPRRTPTRSPCCRHGRRSRTSGSRPRSDTVGRRLGGASAGWPTPTPTARGAACAWSSSRCARCSSRWSTGSASWCRSRCTPGDEADLADVAEALVAAAYTRVDMVERRGEFAVRGGILDVFPPTETTRCGSSSGATGSRRSAGSSVADQRSLEVATDGLWAPPCREILLTDAVRARAARSPSELPGRRRDARRSSPRASPSRAWSPSRRCWWTAWCRCSTWCRPDARRGRADPERVRRRAHDLVATTQEFLAAAWTAAAAGDADADRPARRVVLAG